MHLVLRNILFFFILFISFEAFGLREQGAAGLGNAEAGVYGILQLCYLLVLIAFTTLHFIFYKDIFLQDGLSKSIHLVFILIIVELVFSIFNAISTGYSLGAVFHNLYSLKFYLVFFFITFWYVDIDSLIEMYDTLLYTGIISAVLFLIYIYVYEFPSLIKKLESDEIGRELRYLLPTGMLIAIAMNYQIAKMIYKGFTPLGFIITIVLFWAVFYQMHRNVHLSLMGVAATLFHQFYFSKMKRWIRISAYSIIVLAIVYYVQNIINNEESVVAATVNEVSNGSGGIGIRMAIMANSALYISQHAPIFGIGYLWQDFDLLSMMQTLLVLAPTNDNSYTNVLMVFGFSGILVFGYLLYCMFKALSSISKSIDSNVQVLYLTIRLSLVFILISGLGTDNFLAYNSTIIFVILFSSLNVINKYLYASK